MQLGNRVEITATARLIAYPLAFRQQSNSKQCGKTLITKATEQIDSQQITLRSVGH
jgi:hypothetical protein